MGWSSLLCLIVISFEEYSTMKVKIFLFVFAMIGVLFAALMINLFANWSVLS